MMRRIVLSAIVLALFGAPAAIAQQRTDLKALADNAYISQLTKERERCERRLFETTLNLQSMTQSNAALEKQIAGLKAKIPTASAKEPKPSEEKKQ